MSSPIFFKFITSLVEVYVFFDDETKKQTKVYVARILVRAKYNISWIWINIGIMLWIVIPKGLDAKE